LIRIKEERPDLYELFCIMKQKLEAMDFDDLEFHIAEELAKSNNRKEIKELPRDSSYEYRIPPHHKDGVLRVKSALEDDYYSIRVMRVWIKEVSPKGAKHGTKNKA